MAGAHPPADWCEAVRGVLAAAAWRGAFVVAFPDYRPDLARLMARRLDLEFVDFRGEVLAPRGWQANSLELAELDRELCARAQTSGVVVHNVEALLATKSAAARGAWLSDFLDRPYPAPVVVPVVLYADALPPDHARSCVLPEAELPEQSLLSRFLH